MKLKKGKGLFTTICTIIVLVLSLSFVITMFGVAISTLTGGLASGTIAYWIVALLSMCAVIYLYWHGIKIIIGVERNTWLFVIVSFIGAAIIGGILMLIAKIFD